MFQRSAYKHTSSFDAIELDTDLTKLQEGSPISEEIWSTVISIAALEIERKKIDSNWAVEVKYCQDIEEAEVKSLHSEIQSLQTQRAEKRESPFGRDSKSQGFARGIGYFRSKNAIELKEYPFSRPQQYLSLEWEEKLECRQVEDNKNKDKKPMSSYTFGSVKISCRYAACRAWCWRS